MTGLDWAVMGAYGAVVLAIGWAAGRGHQSAGDFFLGRRRIPAWAVFFSMVATELSAATFIGVPHAAYGGDWSYLQLAFGALAAKLTLAAFVIPHYHRLGLVTVYGLLGRSFGPRSRLCSAWFFLAGRVLASGVRLFIAGLAFAAVTGFSVPWAIVLAGTVACAYTFAGGIRAVIWTDTLQGIVFVVAAAATLILVGGRLDGGLAAALHAAGEAGKTEVFHLPAIFQAGPGAGETLGALGRLWEGFRTNYLQSDASLALSVVGAFFLVLATHGTDQDMVQRLLTTRDGRSGGRALWITGVTNFPLTLLFLLMGTCLWAFYQGPDRAFDGSYGIADSKRIFPLFVLHEMPAGLRGFVFAGLFAAAMSSLDSAVNALATTFCVDIAGRRRLDSPPSMTFVKISTLIFSVLVVGAALLFVPYERIASAGTEGFNLVKLALSAMMIVYGGLLGAFLVALLTPGRGTDRSVLTGMIGGGLTGLLLFLQPNYLDEVAVNYLWWIIIGTLVSFALGAAVPRKRGT